MTTAGAALVYPTFELSPEAVVAIEAVGIPRQHVFGKVNSVFPVAHRIDVPVALADNDFRALLYVHQLLQRDTRIDTVIVPDHEAVADPDRPLISFGLSSNDVTHMVLELPNPMFSVENATRGNEFLEYVQLADGRVFSSSYQRNVGLIVRLRPSPQLYPHRWWFLCAGLGPRGTSGAAWLLATHWRMLQQRVGDNQFVAVISCRTFSDQTTVLEHLYIDDRKDGLE
ncbi:hypothetical protein EBN03_12025 [Nocardia stercoris]|uniref:Uncharacterized protein n=2 Tax=Nocardia stercoris TaxID=2483361 RepID=A0A3M2LDC0_9NOCA|nr:hypothetical protein EBN03_12025 [Nocardia stercoris]